MDVRRASLFVFVFALWSPLAAAQAPPDADVARVAYEEGVGHLEASRFQEAALALERSYALRPVPVGPVSVLGTVWAVPAVAATVICGAVTTRPFIVVLGVPAPEEPTAAVTAETWQLNVWPLNASVVPLSLTTTK